MKDKLTLPIPTHTRDQFDPVMFNDFQRRLLLFFQELVSTGPCEIHTLKLTGLPSTDTGQRANAVFVENGYLKLAGETQASHRKAGTATIADTTSTIAVTFTTAMADTNYSIGIGVSVNETVWYTSKATTGFTLNRSGTSGAHAVDWIVIPYSDL